MNDKVDQPINDKLDNPSESLEESTLKEDPKDIEKEEGIKLTAKRVIPKWKILIAVVLLGFLGQVIYSMEDDTWLDDLDKGAYSDGLSKIADQAIVNLGFGSDELGSTEALMKQFRETLPVLRSEGFYMTQLEIGIGLPPMIVPHFYHEPNEYLNLSASKGVFKDNPIGTILLTLLQEANELQLSLSTSSISFNAIEIELGPMPYLKIQHVSPRTDL